MNDSKPHIMYRFSRYWVNRYFSAISLRYLSPNPLVRGGV